MNTSSFYDSYHQKNAAFFGVITKNNFTYFYILQTLQRALTTIGKGSWHDIRVLDVGCGVGTLGLFLAAQGARVTGIDISQRAINIAKDAQDQIQKSSLRFEHPVTFQLKQISELKSSRPKKDMVISTEVIEHVKDDHQFLLDIRKQLRPGGVLMLTTPSSENLLFKLGYYRTFDADVGHLRRYTRTSIRATCEKAGFTVVSISEVEGPLRNLLFTSKLGFLIRFIKGPLIPFFHVFDRLSAYFFGAADLQVVAVYSD